MLWMVFNRVGFPKPLSFFWGPRMETVREGAQCRGLSWEKDSSSATALSLPLLFLWRMCSRASGSLEAM